MVNKKKILMPTPRLTSAADGQKSSNGCPVIALPRVMEVTPSNTGSRSYETHTAPAEVKLWTGGGEAYLIYTIKC